MSLRSIGIVWENWTQPWHDLQARSFICLSNKHLSGTYYVPALQTQQVSRSGQSWWPERKQWRAGSWRRMRGQKLCGSRWGILSPSTRTKGIIKELNRGRASSEVHFEKVPLPVRWRNNWGGPGWALDSLGQDGTQIRRTDGKTFLYLRSNWGVKSTEMVLVRYRYKGEEEVSAACWDTRLA